MAGRQKAEGRQRGAAGLDTLLGGVYSRHPKLLERSCGCAQQLLLWLVAQDWLCDLAACAPADAPGQRQWSSA